MDKTLLKGLSVIEALMKMDGETHSIDSVALYVGLTRSNTHRTLQTLVHAGYVIKDPIVGGYRGTLKMFQLGSHIFNRLNFRDAAKPYMEKLANATGDTIHLSVLESLHVIYVDKIESVQPIQAYSTVGGQAPAYAVATGKALLAANGDNYLEALTKQLVAHTNATITDPQKLKAELTKTHKRGYAINKGEWRSGVGGIAAVVLDGLNRPIAALGISATLDRLSATRIKKLAPLIVETTAEFSAAMGHH